MKIHFEELIKNGFKQTGNWWIKGNVSVNLLSNTVLHGHKPSFSIEFDELGINDITLNDINDFSNIMAKMTGYER